MFYRNLTGCDEQNQHDNKHLIVSKLNEIIYEPFKCQKRILDTLRSIIYNKYIYFYYIYIYKS